jgi:UDP-N-acetylmuramoyl-tripeptide--D-alanyl-D-alanine ligase
MKRLRRGPPRIDGPVHVRVARRPFVWVLGLLAQAVLRRYRPVVVAVTGSVGKSTTRALTAAVLATRFDIGTTSGNANSEVGVPATIIGGPSRRSWARGLVVLDGLRLLLRRRPFPELLVLEIAAGRPGELKRLTKRVRPDVAVVTNVRPVHRGLYDSFEGIVREKSWPVRRLHPSGTAVLSRAEPVFDELAGLAPGRVVTYGSAEADVELVGVEVDLEGSSARIRVRDDVFPVATRLLGEHQYAGVLAAVATGLALGVPPREALAALDGFEAPPGRLRAHRTDGLVVLDDTNNASPQAIADGLEVLARFPGPRCAVLGTAILFGPEVEPGHRQAGEAAAKHADRLVAVGEYAPLLADAARGAGMKDEDIVLVPDAEEAARIVAAARSELASVYVKGAGPLGLELVVTTLVPNAEVVSRPALRT